MIIPSNILKFDKMLFPYGWKASELENGLKVWQFYWRQNNKDKAFMSLIITLIITW